MQGISANGLRQLLVSNVVQLVFTRRHEKLGYSAGRRMLCTLDRALLNSLAGKLTLNFRVPTHPPAYNAKAHNLVCAWDIMWQDYRMIPIESVNIEAVVPTKTKAQQHEFWVYFSSNFMFMYAKEKEKYMNA